MMRKALFMVAVAGIVASSALGASITSVGVLNSASPYSDVKALTVQTDGTIWAVGGSTSATTGLNNPYVWSSTGGMVELSNPSGAASDARGVSIIYQGVTEPHIAVSGSIGSIARGYTAPLTALTTGTWVASGATPNNYQIGSYNTSRTDQSRADGRTQIAGTNPNASRGAKFRFFPSVGLGDYPLSSTMQSLSNSGVTVGMLKADGRRYAVYGPTVNSDAVKIPGGNNVYSEGYGVSENGQWFSGLDAYGASGSSPNQGFRWKLGDAGMTLLGRYGADTVACAYAISNNGLAVGSTYNATESNRAVVWGSGGYPVLLKDLLNSWGVDTSEWTNLTRLTTVSADGKYVGGYGVRASDGKTVGFVAELNWVPEPASALLLALGVLVLRRRR